MPDTLTEAPVSVSSSSLNWRTMPATVKWPQSPLVSQRAVTSGRALSPLLKRVPVRYGVTVVCGFSTENDHGPWV